MGNDCLKSGFDRRREKKEVWSSKNQSDLFLVLVFEKFGFPWKREKDDHFFFWTEGRCSFVFIFDMSYYIDLGKGKNVDKNNYLG